MTSNFLDDFDRALVEATQAGLPLNERPYHAIAEQIGITPESVIERLQRMQNAGIVRRIGVVPNHYALGFVGNGMSVWDVDDAFVHHLGARVGQLDFVSHCYLRPRHLPVWPYNLFAMAHGHDRDEVRLKVGQIRGLLGEYCRSYDILFSKRILKKTGLRL
jgi:DNA-binding Lrp family transcriptional regulator